MRGEQEFIKTGDEKHQNGQDDNEQGLTFERIYTEEDTSPYDMFEYEKRSSKIKNPDGSIVREMDNVEVPKDWSQMSTDILAQKYFRKKQVPLTDEDGEPLIDEETGEQKTGSENSIKQVAHRLAGCWREWGEEHNYFKTEKDAQIFYEELVYMLMSQTAAPNSPQWFNTGLNTAYDITGNAQGHYYVDEKTGQVEKSKDAYTRPQPHACFIQRIEDDLVNDGGIFDLVTREARLFKYGSGTGSNFSPIRAKGEPLSGGGSSSGLMSFLKVFDQAAGSIKSGGTTRRAAKMVTLDVDHPEIVDFVEWKVHEEKKVASLVSGSKNCSEHLNNIMEVAREHKSTDLKENQALRKEVQKALNKEVPINYVKRVLQLVEQGETEIDFPELGTGYESEAYRTVSGQNSNNSVRIPNSFFKAVDKEETWQLINRTDGSVNETIEAQELWDTIKHSAWMSADPGVQYDTTINEWHTCPNDGRINGSNPCSEYLFLDDTACNLASINLAKFYNQDEGTFDIQKFRNVSRIWTVVLELSVLMAQFPSKEIAKRSYQYRTLGLGFANIGTLLMRMGLPYDSKEGRNIAASITATMCGEAYRTSAEMARELGTFERYEANKDPMLRVIRNHRRAAYDVPEQQYEGLTTTPKGIKEDITPNYLVQEAQSAWDDALEMGKKHGYRNAQTTCIAPTGTIGLVMDCDTTGIEPDFALVKHKKLSGGGYFKIVNQSVPKALDTLGYNENQTQDIIEYAVGKGTLEGSPHINHETLKDKGFTDEKIEAIEGQLKSTFELPNAFNKWTLGEDFLKNLGFTDEQLENPDLNILDALGFTKDQIREAEEYVCGTMTVEGAPHLKDEHLPVFDCANRCGKKGERFIEYSGHIKMLGATQPFISGGISKTINMDEDASVEDVGDAYREAWNQMVKAVALYRDGSKLSQPLNTQDEEESELLKIKEENDVDREVGPEEMQKAASTAVQQRKMPNKRQGFVQEATVGGQKVFLRTGEYENGELGEIFIDTYKEGASYGALLNCFAVAVSKGLQYGVPLQEFVQSFTFTRFEPSGTVSGHPNIKNATSIVDYLFRVLGYEYLGREDFIHVDSSMESLDNKAVNQEKKKQAEREEDEKQLTMDKQDKKIYEAKAKGYTGEQCSKCGSMKVKRNGNCEVCEDCGETTGCS